MFGRKLTKQNLRLAANHEAGHALAEWALRRAKKLIEIKIFEDGSGYTAFKTLGSRATDLQISLAGAMEEARYSEKKFTMSFLWWSSYGDAMAVEDLLYMVPPEHSERRHLQPPWSFSSWVHKTEELLKPYRYEHGILTLELLKRRDVSGRMARNVLQDWDDLKTGKKREFR